MPCLRAMPHKEGAVWLPSQQGLGLQQNERQQDSKLNHIIVKIS